MVVKHETTTYDFDKSLFDHDVRLKTSSRIILSIIIITCTHHGLANGWSGFADVGLEGLGRLDLSDDNNVHCYLFSTHFWFLVGFRKMKSSKNCEHKSLMCIGGDVIPVSYLLTEGCICASRRVFCLSRICGLVFIRHRGSRL